MKKIITLLFVFFALISKNTYSETRVEECFSRPLRHINDFQLLLYSCNLDDKDVPDILDYLSKYPKFYDVDLSNNKITDEGMRLLSSAKSIHDLYMDSNKLTTQGISYFSAMKLDFLSLYRSNVDIEGARILAKINSLSQLFIDDNQIGDAGAIELSKSKSLRGLTIENNNIGYDGASALAKSKILRWLSIGNNHIGNAGAIALASNNTLDSLEVNNDDITDEGAIELAKMPLRLLNIKHNNLSPSTIEYLKEHIHGRVCIYDNDCSFLISKKHFFNGSSKDA